MGTNGSDNCLLIAARDPVAGRAKTRLGATIGMDAAAELYRAFLADLATRFIPAAGGQTFDLVWAHTPCARGFREVLAGLDPPAPEGNYRCVRQRPGSWDFRQAHLLSWGRRQGYHNVILIASDSPHLTISVVNSAFQSLSDHDLVIGRVLDGGYYLIGASRECDVLSGVPMSCSDAASGVVHRAHSQQLTVAEVFPTFDIDVLDDLIYLRELLQPDGHLAPATWAALQRLDLLKAPQERLA